MAALVIIGWAIACLSIAAILYGALCLAGRSDDQLDDWSDRLENGDCGSLPPLFHSTANTSVEQ